MTQLVHGSNAINALNLFFHESAHDIARAEEVVFARMLVIDGVESVAPGLFDQLVGKPVGGRNQRVAGLGRYEILEDEATCGLPCGSGSRRRAVDGIIGESGGWNFSYTFFF